MGAPSTMSSRPNARIRRWIRPRLGRCGVVVQRQTDPARGPVTRAADGIRLSACQCDHPARGAVRRPARGHPLSLQHRRRRLRELGGRLPASTDARDAGQRHLLAVAPDSRCYLSILRPAAAGPARQPGTTVAADRFRVMAGMAIALWLLLPSAYVMARAAPLVNERLVAPSEGLTEIITVMEWPAVDARCSPTVIRCPRPRGSRSGTCARLPTFLSFPWTTRRPCW